MWAGAGNADIGRDRRSATRRGEAPGPSHANPIGSTHFQWSHCPYDVHTIMGFTWMQWQTVFRCGAIVGVCWVGMQHYEGRNGIFWGCHSHWQSRVREVIR